MKDRVASLLKKEIKADVLTMPQQHTFFKQFFLYFFFLVEMVNLGLVYIKINLITLDHSKN